MSALVHFESRIGNLIMFKQHATQLLQLMGLSGEVPSAILPEDISVALTRAREHPSLINCSKSDSKSAYNDNNVNLRTRAKPLFDLLERAKSQNCEVIWH
ncbi:MAG: DUF1840 domain-containing protein [Burkholderiales bacterium]|nr:MAG: hypothetical protein CBB82_02885 [Betaproteobacteria bacterium TMED22]|tara:strand:- start:12 stop:311 length:300 start_codon:yes stop_codon:yes gene_type:complete